MSAIDALRPSSRWPVRQHGLEQGAPNAIWVRCERVPGLSSNAQRLQQEAAAERFDQRTSERAVVVSALQNPGGFAAVNSPERLAMRLDRLSRYYSGEPVPATAAQVPETPPAQLIESALERASASAASDQARGEGSAGMATAGVKAVADAAEAVAADTEPNERAGIVLERVINSADFLDVRFLEAGVAAARAVCRIAIQGPAGPVGFGTGSLVSPSLLLTNHHVLESADVARRSRAEFNFQDGLDGAPLPTVSLGLDPDRFFVANEERDFALVAVAASPAALSQFGLNPLIEAEGKAVVGEFVTIIQHPRGNKKQVALRENRIVDLLDAFVHYEADTEPGSSGSPVFNDQWEIVALHHASVPAPGQDELGGFMNEGIRASRIVKFVRAQALPSAAQALADRLFAPERLTIAAASTEAPDTASSVQPAVLSSDPSSAGLATTRVNVPLEITVRIGAPESTGQLIIAREEPVADEEAISIDPDYSNRRGYDPSFLGGGTEVPLPRLSAALLANASTNTQSQGDTHLFHYNHFSVAMNTRSHSSRS
jgi:endonuclease G, mitochondrial